MLCIICALCFTDRAQCISKKTIKLVIDPAFPLKLLPISFLLKFSIILFLILFLAAVVKLMTFQFYRSFIPVSRLYNQLSANGFLSPPDSHLCLVSRSSNNSSQSIRCHSTCVCYHRGALYDKKAYNSIEVVLLRDTVSTLLHKKQNRCCFSVIRQFQDEKVKTMSTKFEILLKVINIILMYSVISRGSVDK